MERDNAFLLVANHQGEHPLIYRWLGTYLNDTQLGTVRGWVDYVPIEHRTEGLGQDCPALKFVETIEPKQLVDMTHLLLDQLLPVADLLADGHIVLSFADAMQNLALADGQFLQLGENVGLIGHRKLSLRAVADRN
jgi:hypothetical protein